MTLEGQVHVIADPKTNKLIVTASGRDYLAIQDVIRQLDEPRRQVYIETVVLTVNTSNDLGIGTSSHGAIPTTGGNSIEHDVSTPSIIAVDNVTTKFHVGQNVPYTKGLAPTVATNPLAGTSVNVDRQDHHIELDIKPHISSNANVMLEITNDAKEYGVDTSLGPTWNTRGFETRVVVHDQQTIVLTGLTQEHESVKSTKVPVI